MKKSISINLAGTIFSVDEDAFARLQRYLEAVKHTFATVEDGQEIIEDIEHRIAEQFIERDARNERIVTLVDVDFVIGQMGEPESMTDDAPNAQGKTSGTAANDTAAATGANTQTNGSKRLFRDEEHGMLAGVCAGIAAYTGIDVVFIRIIFLILVFAQGIGVIAYIILWIAMPAAKTVADKMQMHGEPLTIESIKTKAEEFSKNTEKRQAIAQNIGAAIQKFGNGVGAFVRAAAPLVGKVIGTIVATVSFVLLIVISYAIVASVFGFFGWTEVRDVISAIPRPQYELAIVAASITILLPIISLFFAGAAWMQGRASIIPTWLTIVLVGLWFLAVSITGSVASAHEGSLEERYKAIVEQTASTEQRVQIQDISIVDGIDVSGVHTVRVLPGNSNEIVIRGSERRAKYTEVKQSGSELIVQQKSRSFICLPFCVNGEVDIEIHHPAAEKITEIDLSGASRMVIVEEALENKRDEAGTAIGGVQNSSTRDLTVQISGASHLILPNLHARSLDVDISGASRVELSGAVTSADFIASGESHLYAAGLKIGTGIINTSGASTAVISAEQLEIEASGASKLQYLGSTTGLSTNGVSKVVELTSEELLEKDTLSTFTAGCAEQPFTLTCSEQKTEGIE